MSRVILNQKNTAHVINKVICIFIFLLSMCQFNVSANNGLTQEYYFISGSNQYFNDVISFFYTNNSVHTQTVLTINESNVPNNTSYHWHGYFFPPITGSYTFKTHSDDASYVYINNSMVLNNGGIHSGTTKTGTITLSKNKVYAIDIYFGNGPSGGHITFHWKQPGGSYSSDLSVYFNTSFNPVQTTLEPPPPNIFGEGYINQIKNLLPTAYYTFDNINFNKDEMGTFHGSYVGSVGPSTTQTHPYSGTNSKSLYLSPATGYATTEATPSNLGLFNQSFTVMTWFYKSPSTMFNLDLPIVGTSGPLVDGQSLHLNIRYDGTTNSFNPYFGFYGESTHDFRLDTIINDNQWYNIVWRYNDYDQKQEIFINCDFKGVQLNRPALLDTDPVYIGRWLSNIYFKGYIDDVAFFNRALTNAEIQQFCTPAETIEEETTATIPNSINKASFTPSELHHQIVSVILSTKLNENGPSGETITLYECNSDDCLVDLTDPNKLSTFKVTKEIKAVPFRYLTISSCKESEETYLSKLKGSVSINEQVYYTDSTNGLMKQPAAIPEEEVFVRFKYCNTYYELQSDFLVTDSTNEYLSLFLDLTYISRAYIGTGSSIHGCMASQTNTNNFTSVCMETPHLVPIISPSLPNIERYFIDTTTKEGSAGSLIVLFTEGSDKNSRVLGGFTRKYFSPSSEALGILDPIFGTSIKRITTSDNFTLSFSTFGYQANRTLLNFPNFKRENHTGYFTDEFGNSYQYIAEKVIIP